jgi:hypothetical protein
MPIMLQQGFELLAGKLVMLLRATLALEYIPMSWRHIRVVFIPKFNSIQFNSIQFYLASITATRVTLGQVKLHKLYNIKHSIKLYYIITIQNLIKILSIWIYCLKITRKKLSQCIK